jgi:hypothetical protein
LQETIGVLAEDEDKCKQQALEKLAQYMREGSARARASASVGASPAAGARGDGDADLEEDGHHEAEPDILGLTTDQRDALSHSQKKSLATCEQAALCACAAKLLAAELLQQLTRRAAALKLVSVSLAIDGDSGDRPVRLSCAASGKVVLMCEDVLVLLEMVLKLKLKPATHLAAFKFVTLDNKHQTTVYRAYTYGIKQDALKQLFDHVVQQLYEATGGFLCALFHAFDGANHCGGFHGLARATVAPQLMQQARELTDAV